MGTSPKTAKCRLELDERDSRLSRTDERLIQKFSPSCMAADEVDRSFLLRAEGDS